MRVDDPDIQLQLAAGQDDRSLQVGVVGDQDGAVIALAEPIEAQDEVIEATQEPIKALPEVDQSGHSGAKPVKVTGLPIIINNKKGNYSACHSERSEESNYLKVKTLRYTQGDTFY